MGPQVTEKKPPTHRMGIGGHHVVHCRYRSLYTTDLLLSMGADHTNAHPQAWVLLPLAYRSADEASPVVNYQMPLGPETLSVSLSPTSPPRRSCSDSSSRARQQPGREQSTP
jgi:hypothetical protein